VDVNIGNYVKKAGDTMTGELTLPTLKVSTTTAAKHIAFSRADGPNYLCAPTGGSIGFCIHETTNIANSSMLIANTSITPGTSGVVDLGTSSKKWNKIYGTQIWGAVWNDYAEYR
jgi:hypothetical protein